jgi:hypothetical protein
MSQARAVLQEVKERRLTEERIEALKTPWYRWRPSLQVQALTTALFILAFFKGELSADWEMGFRIAFLGLAGWSLVTALNVRDRMWRELIQREAPELHERLQKGD